MKKKLLPILKPTTIFGLFLVLSFWGNMLLGQVNMTITGSYTQNFDGLANSGSSNSWTDNNTIANWYWQTESTSSGYDASTGSSSSGKRYSFGATSSTERAMGSVGSGTPDDIGWGILLRNTSGSAITDIKITYRGEQWRNGGNITAQTVDFAYKTSSSSFSSLDVATGTGWVDVNALDFTSPINTSSAAALDGNNSTNYVQFTNVAIPSLSLNNNDYIMIRWRDIDHTGADHGLSIDDVTISWTIAGSSTPTITAPSPTSLSGFSTTTGTASSSQTFTVGGSNLTAKLIVTAPSNFELRENGTGSFGSSVSFEPSSGTVASKTIEVRIAASAGVGSPSGNVVCSSTDATSQNVAVSGTVSATPDPEPTNHATDFLAAENGTDKIDIIWDDNDGTQVAAGVVLLRNTTGTFTAPVDGTDPSADADLSDGSALVKIAHGVESQTFTGLDDNTTYYFKIWPYTNSGSDINFKTDGAVPTADATTDLYSEPQVIIARNCDPQANFEPDRFVEIYNAGNVVVDLTGWTLENIQGGAVLFTWTLSGNINPGETKICARDNATLQTITPDFIATWAGNSWNGKGNDGSKLKDNNGDVIDNAVQSDATGTFENKQMKRKLTINNPTSTYNSNEWVFSSVTNANDVVPGFHGTVWIDGADWSTLSNWDCEVPTISSDVTIPSSSTGFPTISGITAVTDNLTLQNGAEITVATDGNLTIYGDFTNGAGTLTIESDASGDGSVIVEGGMIGAMVVERYIPAYSGDDDGWHLLSSPRTASFDLSTSNFVPIEGNDDVYNWNEGSYTWENYFGEDNPGFDFVPGYGYLVAYSTAPTPVREFSGYMNNQDFPIGSLTNTDNNINDAFDGWHLLGNPYTSALKWNDGNWSLIGINATAKIYNEDGGNYIDVAPNAYIPMNQGFFVQVSAAPGSLTIPLASREHNATGWYKSDVNMQELKLKVIGGARDFYDYSTIRFNEMASESFDSDFDSYKMYGMASAPQIMTVLNTNEEASTNVLPFSNNERIVPLNFKAGTNDEFTISVEVNTVSAEGNIYLEDQFTDQMINLSTHNSYTFDATIEDNANRFLLHFNGVTGEESVEDASNIQVYSGDGMIYINNLDDLSANILVYNVNGQLVAQEQMNGESLKKIDFQAAAGIYLVSIQSEGSVETQKVYVK